MDESIKNSRNGIDGFVLSFMKLNSLHEELFLNESFNKSLLVKNIRLVREKKYAITDEIWAIQEEKNLNFLLAFIELIKSFAVDYRKDADKLLFLFKENKPLVLEFITDILTNKQKKIVDFSRQNNISEDFIIFFSVFSAIPFRKAAAELIRKEIDFKIHVSGFCPVCGHWPVMAYLVGKEMKKTMACICCGTSWLFRRLTCPFCLNSNNNDLGYLHIEEEKTISAYTCSKCRRYIKTKIVSDVHHTIKLEEIILDYLASGDLDIAAVQNKFIHESLIGTRFQGPDDKHIDVYLQKLFQPCL